MEMTSTVAVPFERKEYDVTNLQGKYCTPFFYD